MRVTIQFIFCCSFMLLVSCVNESSVPKANKFKQFEDTLILETHLEKGVGLFHPGAGGQTFKDTTEWKNLDYFTAYPDYPFWFPNELDSMKLGFGSLVMNPLRYYDPITAEEKIQQNLTKKDKLFLSVKGFLEGKEVFIIDQNHNQDLTDDSVRSFKELDWYSIDDLIDCHFTVKLEDEDISEVGWINIGHFRGSLLRFSSQYVVADFSIGKNEFQIGVMDDNSSSFCFFNPQMAVLAENGVRKDTLLKKEFLYMGEYIKIGDEHYRFDDFYNGSGTIVLVKEKEFDKQVGIQVGLLAPDFTIKTVHGDTLSKADLSDKPILIVNLTGCGGPGTFEKYDTLIEQYADSYHIVALEPRINENLEGILVDSDDEFNKDFYKKYRDAYSSYDCLHINEEGRIANVFGIWNWESSFQ